MCIRTCQVPIKGPNGKNVSAYRVEAGTQIDAKEAPNKHFIELGDESKTLHDILSEKLSKYGIDTTDEWDTDRMQRMVAEQEALSYEPEEKAMIKKYLDEIGVRYHHAIGLKKLRQLAHENNIEV